MDYDSSTALGTSVEYHFVVMPEESTFVSYQNLNDWLI